MLRLSGESRYRAAAYDAGAGALEALAEDLSVLIDQDRLTEVRGIGPSLATTITELARSGRSPVIERIRGQFPPGLLQLAHLPGLTIRRIRMLHEALGIGGLRRLAGRRAAGAAVATVKGFGPQTVARLRTALETPPPAMAQRWLLVETVADLNLLAGAPPGDAASIIQALAAYPAVAAVVDRQERSCRVRLSNGLPVTLTIEVPDRFAVGLLLSTGSAAHLPTPSGSRDAGRPGPEYPGRR